MRYSLFCILFLCVLLSFALNVQQNLSNTPGDYCLSLSHDTDLFLLFCCNIQGFISFPCVVYLKLQTEYITYGTKY